MNTENEPAEGETTDAGEAGEFVPLDGKKPSVGPTEPSDAVNLVPLMLNMKDKKGKPLLESMSSVCIDDYDADVNSRRERMKKIDEFEKLFASVMKSKNFPFQNAAVVNLPFLGYVVLQTHARLYDMVIPANGNILLVSPTNLSDVEGAEYAEVFSNSYIRHDMPEFAPGMDMSLMQMCIAGSAFRRTYWNAYDVKVCSDAIPMSDFVVSYWEQCKDPSMRGVPRYTLVMHPTIFDLEDYAAQGLYENVDKIKPGDVSDKKNDSEQLRETVKKQDGVKPSDESSDDDKPRMVLEQYRRWRMPNKPAIHPSFDGRSHYVIITIDEASREVLRVVVREEDDPKDAKRFEKESALFDQHQAAVKQYDSDTEGFPIAAQVAQAQGQPVPEPPMPPVAPAGLETDDTGEPLPPKGARQREICFFTHYKCFPGEGFYGLGFGDFIAPLNKAANTILNQHIDGVTLRNARPGFISRQLRGQRGAVDIQPGQLVEVDAPLGVLKDGIVWLDPPQSDGTTMQLVELLQSMVEKFGGSDILSGEAPGSNQTATGMNILNEQAMAPITVLSRRVKEAERHELEKIWRCFGTFLPDEEIADVIDQNGDPQQIPIGRSLFRPDMRVQPVSDTRMKTQKVQETQAVLQATLTNPLTQGNQKAIQKATEDNYRAMDANYMIPIIQPPPQPEPPPPVPSWTEDAGFLRGQDHPVHPQDDDQAHIAGHQAFRQTPPGQALDPTAAKMHDQHIRNHMANNLEKTGQAHEQMVQQAQQQPQPGPVMQ